MNTRDTKRFRKHEKRMYKRGKDSRKLQHVIYALLTGTLPAIHNDHALKGKYRGKRSCHIEPNWILIYEIVNDTLFLHDTGTHADLYGM